jgi:hypothetical protein
MVISHLQQQQGSPETDLCTLHGMQQGDSIIVNFFSVDSPTGMFKQLPIVLSAQQSLLSSLDRQLPSDAQQTCEGTELNEVQAALKLSARGKKSGSDGLPHEFCLPTSMTQLHLAVQGQGLQGPVGQLPPHCPPQQRLQAVGRGSGYPLWACPSKCGLPQSGRFFFFSFFLGYRGIVHSLLDDEGTERTWFEPEQRPRKRVPKRSVHGKQGVPSMPAGANRDTKQNQVVNMTGRSVHDTRTPSGRELQKWYVKKAL